MITMMIWQLPKSYLMAMMNDKLMDIFRKDASFLRYKKLWLFDMDGTIYEENKLFEGALKLLNKIKKNGGEYVFITNNSSKSIDDYINKVRNLGITADKDNFFTSSQATILYLKDKYPFAKVYCQGTKSFIKELMASSINVTEEMEDDVDIVLVGFDTELTSEKLRKTCQLLKKDTPFIATNCDLRCPVAFGFIPDCGSICQMITNATDKKPVFIGKPESTMVEYVMKKFSCSKEETVVIGDRLYTDIATGINAGVTSVCVLTGEATVADIIKGNIKPTLAFKSVNEIFECLS